MVNNLLPNVLAHRIAIKVTSHNKEFLRQTDEIRYGMEWILTASNQLLIILIIAFPLNIIPEALILMLSGAVLRMFSGGAHCKGYFQCLIVSTVQITASALIAKHAFAYLITIKTALIIFLVLSLLIIILKAPVLNKKKKKFNKKQKYQLKCISALTFIGLLLTSLFFLKDSTLMFSIWLALILQCFTLTAPAKMLFSRI